MKQVDTRKSSQGTVETLVVVDSPIPFHQVVHFVREQGAIDSSVYYLVDRTDPSRYGHWEHLVFNLMMRIVTHRTCNDVWDLCFDDYEPVREETRRPCTLPVTTREAWKTWKDADWRFVSVVSLGAGWDFYDVEWLLHKWESALGLFDDDILCLCIPIYPKDLYNERVPPEVVTREVDRYARERGEDALQRRFFALYWLCRDPVGKRLLSFFYGYRGDETPAQVFDALYEMREAVPVDHGYRPYLLEKNYSVLDLHRRLLFKPYMLLGQFLSYHGMYVSKDFYMRYRRDIGAGFAAHRKELHMTPYLPEHWKEADVANWMDRQFALLYHHLGQDIQWAGKWHLEKVVRESLPRNDPSLWSALLAVWDFIPRRNIFLWEKSSFRYNEYQLRIGHEFRLLFDTKTLRSMTTAQKKKFDQIFHKTKKIK